MLTAYHSLKDLWRVDALSAGQSLDVLQAFQLYLQLMSILAILNVEWPRVLGDLFSACAYLSNLAPQVQGALLALLSKSSSAG